MGEQPKTRSEIRGEQRRRSTSPLLIGAVAVLLIGSGIWLGKSLFFDGQPTASPVNTSAPTASLATSTTSTSATPTETADPTAAALAASIASCRDAWQLRSAAMSTAATALGKWATHLAIMNDLQANKITLATAKARWPATTANAPADIKAFREADAALAASKTACAAPDAAVTGPQADALRTCAASAAAADGILAQARTAIRPWELHLSEQSHFKAGEVTPAVAEAKWRIKWQEGLKTLPGYTNAVKSAGALTCQLPA
ncbi:hypothetical protein N865_19110 [Intrasporangium oryzae NRRL B-24470]|uniref:Uncharacterized protein n=1 Tax=Intrasporangium oryzae NRRL B-24470 TaxID=1386089 RepID=W9GBB5_9MICO|nr:hypothetical protein [Intrasporangium oryzae]EWT03375.1 hypothetical protein N865_19110 [Intrasporangium oryzae NRRL B-24470]